MKALKTYTKIINNKKINLYNIITTIYKYNANNVEKRYKITSMKRGEQNDR